jgi:hypothetical protein
MSIVGACCCVPTTLKNPLTFARGLNVLYGAEGSRTPVHPCLLTYHSSTGLAALTQAAGTNFIPVSGIHCQILAGYATEDGLQSTHCIAYTRRGSKCKPRFCYAARATRAREKGTMLFALIVLSLIYWDSDSLPACVDGFLQDVEAITAPRDLSITCASVLRQLPTADEPPPSFGETLEFPVRIDDNGNAHSTEHWQI